MGTNIRDILNKARWKDADLHALEIHVVHRGAPGDQRAIAGSKIMNVGANGIDLTPEDDESESVFVPYHRFLAIVGLDGAQRWPLVGGAAAGVAVPSAPTSEPSIAEPKEIVSDLNVVLRTEEDGTLVIDGSAGEGGGQLLRTSLTLSMITGKPFILEKIRAGRKKPGLMRQHLTCVKAAAEISGAEIEGAELKSMRLVFRPKAINEGNHVFDIGSAGSVALVIQTIALALTSAWGGSRIVLRGGTHAQWAPIFPFLEEAWLPLVRRAGAHVSLELKSHGFYPAGGGEVVLKVDPIEAWKPLHLATSGILAPLGVSAIVSSLAEGIARRELSAAAELLHEHKVNLTSATVKSPGPGNAMWLLARDEGTGLVNVFSGIGDPGVKAEDIGQSVANSFIAWRDSGASVEEYLADQVMLPIALAGEGSYTTNELSLHSKTNIEVIHAFTEKRLRCWDLGGNRQIRIALTSPASGAKA
jgi:RNA 3'-terminal phosphate cyclase (ATP)